MKRILISGILIGLFITLGAVAAILYATGYRLEFGGDGTGNIKFVEGTGLVVVTSHPDGARVFVDGKLRTATNNTIDLLPGEYLVEITKDGYIPWKKKIIVKKSLVSEAGARLIPSAPKLEAVTTIGVSNVIMDASSSLLAYTVASASAEKNGIYVFNMNSGPLVFLGASGTQIISDLLDNFSSAQLSFSPDGRQLLAKLPKSYYLLTTSGLNNAPQDVTSTLDLVKDDWAIQQAEADKKLLDSLPRALRTPAKTYFKDMKPSPDNNKILYTASQSATLEPIIKPPIPSVNSTPDQRTIVAGKVYVYDIKEDKNYMVGDSSNNYLWHADSRHLVYAQDKKVNILEYDGGNQTTVFNGDFVDEAIFPWPNGSGVAIVYRLSASAPYNIYRIGLQ